MTRGLRTENTARTWKMSRWLGSQSVARLSNECKNEINVLTVIVECARSDAYSASPGRHGLAGEYICDEG